MSPKEYDCITFYDLNLKIEGFVDNEKRIAEEGRFKAFTSYIAPHLDPKKLKGLTPHKFMPFEWDGAEDVVNLKDKKESFEELLRQINGQIRN